MHYGVPRSEIDGTSGRRDMSHLRSPLACLCQGENACVGRSCSYHCERLFVLRINGPASTFTSTDTSRPTRGHEWFRPGPATAASKAQSVATGSTASNASA